MNLRNRLYKAHFRSHNNFILRDQLQRYEKKLQQQISEIEISLQLMSAAFKNNSKIQEIYMDLIRATDKKMRHKEIKNVYRVLSENKSAEVMFMQEWEKEERREAVREAETGMMGTSLTGSRFKEVVGMVCNMGNKAGLKSQSRDDPQNSGEKIRNSQSPYPPDPLQSHIKECRNTLSLTYRRLYSRLVQSIIKKLTYYITNKPHLNKIILHTASQLSKKLETLMRRILDMKDCKFLYEVGGLIYEENLVVEQKIYDLMVEKGHVVSVEEFFRINGILLEEAEAKKRRESRQSVLSTRRVSELSVEVLKLLEDVNLEQRNKLNSKPIKESRFHQNINKKPQKQYEAQNPDKNQLYIERLNKQIQIKYSSALDKLGDFVQISNRQMALLKAKNATQESKHDESKKYLDPNEEGYKVFKSNKSIASRRKNSSFQYFSSEFTQIIKELDQKKGKVSQFVPEKNKNADSPQAPVQKINRDTISLQNPVNVARLLQKKFKNIQPSHETKPKHSLFLKKPKYSNQATQRHNQIHKLLKIYQNNQKQSHIIDILFGTNFEDQDQKGLQRNFIKLTVMARMKERGLIKTKGNQLECAKFEEFMMKEIEEEYEKLIRSKKSETTQLMKDFLECGQEVLNKMKNQKEKVSEERRRKVVDLEKSYQTDNLQEISSRTNLCPKPDQQVHQQLQPYQSLPSQLQPLFSLPHLTRTMRLTHHPSPSTCYMQLASTSNTFQCFQSKELKSLQTPYNQFTNPLTKQYGYYNQQGYTSLRSSLQKCELNSIKLKRKAENGSLMEVGSNVMFWNREKRREQKKYLRRALLQSEVLKEVKEKSLEDKGIDKEDVKENNSNSNNQSTRSNGLDIFQHQLLQKYMQFHKDKSVDTQKLIKSSQPQLQPEQLKIKRLAYSRSQRNSMSQLHVPSALTSAILTPKYPTQNKLQKITRQQVISLGKDFCLNSQKIEKPKLEFKSADIDKFIDKYLKTVKKTQGGLNGLNKQNVMEQIMKSGLSTGFTSVATSPRHSFKKIKQLYSTTRRIKLQ